MKHGRIIKIVFFTLAVIFTGRAAEAQDFPERPVPPRLVNDFTGMLSNKEADALERKLVAFDDTTSTQIAIVIIPGLHGYSKSDYAQRLAEQWGIGRKGKDNGVLILIKPKTPDSEGQVQITQGYGLEGVIPDLTCSEIVDNDILPDFRQGKFYEGLDKATNTLMGLAGGEFTADDYARAVKKNHGSSTAGIIMFIVIIVLIFAVISGRSGGSNQKNIGSRNLPLWLLLGTMNSGRGSQSGSWGGFSGGGGFGGSGGFGGFGGGSFGGGGAGGSW